MHRIILGCLCVLLLANVARADDDLNPEQLKKLYAETKAQLKAAQDRRAQLASQVADLQKQVQAQAAQIEEYKRQAANYAQNSWYLRCQYVAWQHFMDAHPAIRAQWDLFLCELTPLDAGSGSPFYDPSWPLSGPLPSSAPADH